MTRPWLRVAAALLLTPVFAMAQETLTVGSKRFTESYILGEIVARTATRAGEARGLHRPGMGNTGILFAALKAGSIDVYPEYTGTIARELLGGAPDTSADGLNRALAAHGLAVSVPLGFNNSYALAMTEDQAARLGVRTMSDLAQHPGLRFGLTQEFIARADGWKAVAGAYGLAQTPSGLDHGLAYSALATGQVDVIDLYSTDAGQVRHRLRVLSDDRGVFPRYDAVLLHRIDLPQRLPRTWQALMELSGRLDASRMMQLNAAAELEGRSFGDIAEGFLGGGSSAQGTSRPPGLLAALLADDLGRLTLQHLGLVFGSLLAAVVVAVPCGVAASARPAAGRVLLAGAGVIQTIPALALLAFLIPVTRNIGTIPAISALFLYAMLPIMRNTVAGLQGIPPHLREAAQALALSPRDRLLRIELPLAAPSIAAGIRTAAVINVGTATIAAFVGAGGYGERISAGLALNDHWMLLAGAIPAAALALGVDWAFGCLERKVTRRHTH